VGDEAISHAVKLYILAPFYLLPQIGDPIPFIPLSTSVFWNTNDYLFIIFSITASATCEVPTAPVMLTSCTRS
jgi:hypothetical protein